MKKVFMVGAIAFVVLLPVLAFAGSGGTEFQSVYQCLMDWTQGSLGKAIALGFFLVGLGAGLMRQSLISIVIGVAAALSVNYLPGIMDALVTGII